MKRLLILALFATPALADESQTDILQSALQECVQQRNEAGDRTLNRVAPLVAENRRLQKRVQELEEAAKKPEAPK